MAFSLEHVAQGYCAQSGREFLGGVGQGAFKETYHVRRPDGISEALKVYTPTFSPERTQRELDAMVRCSHPNIAKLFAVAPFAIQGSTYVVVLEEFLSGGTLTSKLEGGRILPDELWPVGMAMIDAIGHIASHGLVHRDLKPDNILFRSDGETPVIVDFGLVRDLSKVSLTQTWIPQGPGTPFFAPPEQLLNEKHMIDWRSDQFSLGVVLSYSTFGFHPYANPDDHPAVVVERVSARGHPAQRFLDAANESGLAALIKMVSAWPVHRYRTAEGLSAAWRAQEPRQQQ
jgi:serine/threonine protein kinase